MCFLKTYVATRHVVWIFRLCLFAVIGRIWETSRIHHLVGGWARNSFCVRLSHHTFHWCLPWPNCSADSTSFWLGGAETLAKSYKGVRGNAHPVCLFNARVASSWKLRNLVFDLAHYSSQVERPMSGSKWWQWWGASPRRSTLPRSARLAHFCMKFGAGAGVDPFVKVEGLITDLINRLQVEASSETRHKSYCDEETSKAAEFSRADVGKQSSKLEAAVARSTVLDGARQGPDRARRRSPRLSKRCERLRDAHAVSWGPLAQDNEELEKVKADSLAAEKADLAEAENVWPHWRRHWPQAWTVCS